VSTNLQRLVGETVMHGAGGWRFPVLRRADLRKVNLVARWGSSNFAREVEHGVAGL
jgi:hypothetical protein